MNRDHSTLLIRSMFGVVLLAAVPGVGEEKTAAPSAEEQLRGMNWLHGAWVGSTKRGRWEASYTSSMGGALVSANKEWVHDRVVMFEFEVFRVVDGKVVLQPYPRGQATKISFTLAASDTKNRSAVFENAAHDFPRRISYHAPEPDRLVIEVSGEMAGQAVIQRLDLRRAGSDAGC